MRYAEAKQNEGAFAMKKTIYLTDQSLWQNEAAGRHLERVSGGEGGVSHGWLDVTAPAGRVVDLTAWKAENLVDLDELEQQEDAWEEPESGLASYEGRELHRRAREKHRGALMLGEAAATLSAAGVMVAMVLRVLAF